jgi:hypothetical protein
MTKLEDAGAKPKDTAPALPTSKADPEEEDDAPEAKVASEGQVEALVALVTDVAMGRSSMLDAGRVVASIVPLTTAEALDLLAPAAAEWAATPPTLAGPPRVEVRMEKGAIEVQVPPPPPAQVHVERVQEPEKVLEFCDSSGRVTKTARLRKAGE